MELRSNRNIWEVNARVDALWSILTDPHKTNNKWQIDEFFQTGEQEIAAVETAVKARGLNFGGKKALDFGCGVGRLTQALAKRFQTAVGVDISQRMIDMARGYSTNLSNCEFRQNSSDDLRQFDDASFDFIYSRIVLQHIKPEYSSRYIREFVRLLTRDGLAVFQLPEMRLESYGKPSKLKFIKEPVKKAFRRYMPWVLFAGFRRIFRGPSNGINLEMHGIDQKAVIALVESSGGEVFHIENDDSAGKEWKSWRYWIRKRVN